MKLERNTAYQLDDIVYTYTGVKLKCTIAGTTSTNPFVLSGTTIVDGTVTWEVQSTGGSSEGGGVIRVGHVGLEYEILPNHLVLDRTEYNRVSYSELVAWVTSNDLWTEDIDEIGKFYVGDGTTTFRVPNFIGKFFEGASTSGISKSAGLPNIKGMTSSAVDGVAGDGVYSGAFRKPVAAYGVNGNNLAYYFGRQNFDASVYNSIYSDNVTTVQPESVTLIPQICYKDY